MENKKLYIVGIKVIEKFYQKDSKEKHKTSHIVWAESEEEAEEKVKLFYRMKEINDYLEYSVYIKYCNEVL